MNKILPEMPTLTGEVYAPTMPMWLAHGLRLFSLLFSLAVAWFGFHDWLNMPAFAKVIVCILAPAFFYFSLSSEKGWALYAKNPFFLADQSGMYFRHNQAFTTFMGNNNQNKKRNSQQCLFVPWSNIANIRVGKVSGSDGAIFDVKASTKEVEAFFDASVKDKKPIQVDMQAVCFYQNMPPTPCKVVAHLQSMMHQYKKSPLREKYDWVR